MEQDPAILTASQLLRWWTGHRQLTRQVLEAFPEDDFSTFSIGGMRTAADMAHELLQLGGALAHGVATGEWPDEFQSDNQLTSKAEMLAAWDADLARISRAVPEMSGDSFSSEHNAYGFFRSSGINQLLYSIENEIHHRGQMYVYLRALGIEPPAFYQRSLT